MRYISTVNFNAQLICKLKCVTKKQYKKRKTFVKMLDFMKNKSEIIKYIIIK